MITREHRGNGASIPKTQSYSRIDGGLNVWNPRVSFRKCTRRRGIVYSWPCDRIWTTQIKSINFLNRYALSTADPQIWGQILWNPINPQPPDSKSMAPAARYPTPNPHRWLTPSTAMTFPSSLSQTERRRTWLHHYRKSPASDRSDPGRTIPQSGHATQWGNGHESFGGVLTIEGCVEIPAHGDVPSSAVIVAPVSNWPRRAWLPALVSPCTSLLGPIEPHRAVIEARTSSWAQFDGSDSLHLHDCKTMVARARCDSRELGRRPELYTQVWGIPAERQSRNADLVLADATAQGDPGRHGFDYDNRGRGRIWPRGPTWQCPVARAWSQRKGKAAERGGPNDPNSAQVYRVSFSFLLLFFPFSFPFNLSSNLFQIWVQV
jgi:hypothetical protein